MADLAGDKRGGKYSAEWSLLYSLQGGEAPAWHFSPAGWHQLTGRAVSNGGGRLKSKTVFLEERTGLVFVLGSAGVRVNSVCEEK